MTVPARPATHRALTFPAKLERQRRHDREQDRAARESIREALASRQQHTNELASRRMVDDFTHDTTGES